jgi:hypothetical protein
MFWPQKSVQETTSILETKSIFCSTSRETGLLTDKNFRNLEQAIRKNEWNNSLTEHLWLDETFIKSYEKIYSSSIQLKNEENPSFAEYIWLSLNFDNHSGQSS